MIRLLLAFAFALVALPAAAQTQLCVAPDVITLGTDSMVGTPTSPPTLCRLYEGSTLVAETPATAPYACRWTRSFSAGAHTLHARYANAAEESGNSNALTFTCVARVVLPPPRNLRVIP